MDLQDQLKNLFPEHKETEVKKERNLIFGYKTILYFANMKNVKENRLQF